jgi:hypothetical protein
LEKVGITTEFYSRIPKDLKSNLLFRKAAIAAGYDSDENAQELWIMCKRDPLFYVNTFLWTYDPRLMPRICKIPFLTFEFQDDAILEIVNAIFLKHDLYIEKSRDEGASWIILAAYKWLFTFYPSQSFRLMSRTEDLVDKTDYDDSLFWKIDFMLEHEPDFLRPPVSRTHLKVKNNRNGSVIHGLSTTGNAGVGGRCGSMLIDEFSKFDPPQVGFEVLTQTRDVTKCRIFNGTPKGTGTAMYAIRETGIHKLRFHWSQDPRKNQGLYTSKNGVVEIIDSTFSGKVSILDTVYDFPASYPFILDGKIRSPWYDNECARASHPMEIAQELDIDWLSSDFQFFDKEELVRIERQDVRKPFWQGELEFDKDTLEFVGLHPSDKGRLKLWIHPDAYGKLPSSLEAVLGADVSTGTGASNSVAAVANKNTREQIAEWIDSQCLPEDFARICVALAKFFNGAYMIWDAGGPGSSFGKRVTTDLRYTNVYYRTDESTIARKVSDRPGYYFTPANKRDTLTDFRSGLKNSEYVVRSQQVITEARDYVHIVSTNSIEHSKSRTCIDPTGAGDNHGDAVIASGLAHKACKVFSTDEDKGEKPEPQNCYAAFKREKDIKKRQQESSW